MRIPYCRSLTHLSKLINDFLYPPFQTEHVSVEAIFPIPVAAFTPGDNTHLIPAVVIGALHDKRSPTVTFTSISSLGVIHLEALRKESSEVTSLKELQPRDLISSPYVSSLLASMLVLPVKMPQLQPHSVSTLAKSQPSPVPQTTPSNKLQEHPNLNLVY